VNAALKRPRRSGRFSQAGFSYAEVLMSVLLLAILLVPALQAMSSGIAGSGSNLANRQLRLRSKMEEVLSSPFGELYAETYLVGGNTASSVSSAQSDASGAVDRRVVVLYRFDSLTNALSSSDTGLLHVGVYYEAEGSGNALSTLDGRWW
jgi:hypothetical protein